MSNILFFAFFILLLSSREHERNKGVVQMKEKCEQWVVGIDLEYCNSIIIIVVVFNV